MSMNGTISYAVDNVNYILRIGDKQDRVRQSNRESCFNCYDHGEKFEFGPVDCLHAGDNDLWRPRGRCAHEVWDSVA